jgi:hypothetical protein
MPVDCVFSVNDRMPKFLCSAGTVVVISEHMLVRRSRRWRMSLKREFGFAKVSSSSRCLSV